MSVTATPKFNTSFDQADSVSCFTGAVRGKLRECHAQGGLWVAREHLEMEVLAAIGWAPKNCAGAVLCRCACDASDF
jgi:hypothetical protein